MVFRLKENDISGQNKRYMQKRRIAKYINILKESCKIETFTEIESLQGPTTLYGRL